MQTRFRFFAVLFAFCMSMSLAAQQRITGLVMSSDKSPIVGASVTVYGTTLSTLTDEEGRFEISAAPDATIVVAYKGYTTRYVAVASLRKGEEMRVVLTEGISRPVVVTRDPRPHRFAVWGAAGALCPEEAFNHPNHSGNYVSVAGEVGVGYQLYHNHFLFTTGLELLLINYKSAIDFTMMTSHYQTTQYRLQVPLLFGMEYPWWYWQGGAKVGFFYHNDLKVEDEKFRFTGGTFMLTPSLEIGTSILSDHTGVNCKLGVFAESSFAPSNASTIVMSSNDETSENKFGFAHFMAGLKFTIAY